MLYYNKEDRSIENTFKGTDCSEQFLKHINEFENQIIYIYNIVFYCSFFDKYDLHGKNI